MIGNFEVAWNGAVLGTALGLELATRSGFGGREISTLAAVDTIVIVHQRNYARISVRSPGGPGEHILFEGTVPDLNPGSDWRFFLRADGISPSSSRPPLSVQLDSLTLVGSTPPYLATPLGDRSSWQDFTDSFQVRVASLEGVTPANINVSVSSSNPALFPEGNLSVSAVAADQRQITLKPARGASGTATITVRLDPGGTLPVGVYTFTQTVSPNIPPSISALSPGGGLVNQPFGFTRRLPFTIGSPRWPANSLQLQAGVADPRLDPSDVFFEPRDGTGTNWNLVFTPGRDVGSGTVSNAVTVSVTDGSGDAASSAIALALSDPALPPATLGGGSALALNVFGTTLPQQRQYAIDTAATDVASGSVATIEAWVFATALPDKDLNVIAAIGTPGRPHGMILAVQSDGSPAMANWVNDFGPTNAAVKITLQRWHHVAAVMNGRAVSLYVDGQLSASGTLAVEPQLLPRYVMVGIEPFEDRLDRPWFGYLDNIRIWSTARSAADIAANHDRLVPPDSPGLVRDFRCDDGFVRFDGANPALASAGLSPGGQLQDFSARQRPATLVGYPSFAPGVSPGTVVNVSEDVPAAIGLGAGVAGTNVWGGAGLARAVYFGAVTNAVDGGLLKSPGWPDSPSVVLAHAGGLEIPPGGPAAYGQAFRGWLLPPETGVYTFAIASANEGQLLLSSDDSRANLAVIARSPATGVGFRRFDLNRSLQTATATLTAGRRYAFEVRHQADRGANGSAHLSVQWTLPSGLVETPIPAQRFQPAGATPPGGALDITLEVQPDYGTLSLAGGVATYTPVSNYFGTDSFVYRVASAGATSAPVVVNLGVLNQDDAPVAGSGNALRLLGGTAGAATTDTFNLGGGSFTLELWARRSSTTPPAANSSQVLWHLAPDPQAGGGPDALLAWQPDGTIGFFMSPAGQGSPLLSGTPYLDTDWHHWAVVFDADTGHREIFRDGTSVNQDVTTNRPPSLAQFFLGSRSDHTGAFQGDVDEVRLWTRVRSAVDLGATNSPPLAGNEDGLLAYYRLDEGNGLASADSSLPKPGNVSLDLRLDNPVSWLSGITNFSRVDVPRNSPGQRIFLPGFDPDGEALTWQILSPTPPNGRLVPDPQRPGAYTYIPNQNFFGPDPIRYQVAAAGRTSVVATVVMDVKRLPIPPAIAPLRDVEFEEEDPPLVVALSLSDVDDPTGNSLTLVARSSNPTLLPASRIAFGGSGNARTATLDPEDGEVGTSTVEIEVSNGERSATASFEVLVNPRLAYVAVNTAESTGQPGAVATAINDGGQLAGWVAGVAAQTNSQPFFFNGYGTAVPAYLVDNLGGATGGALGLNDAGLMVGAVANAQGGIRAFMVDPRQDTTPTDLGVLPGGNLSVATDINNAGLVVGYALIGDGTSRAFTAGTGPLTPLVLTNGYAEMWATAVNNAGEIAGYARVQASGATNAFLQALGQTRDLGRPPGADHVRVAALDETGVVYGHALYSTGAASRAVRWEDGVWTELGDLLGGGRTEVAGANRFGQIVGRALDTNGVWRAFLHTDGRTWDLAALLPGDSDWSLDLAAAINDRAQIAVTGRQGGGPSQALLLFPATEIGRRVFRPEGTLPEMPQITLIPASQGTQEQYFFWSTGDRKLFAIKPGVAEIRWRTGTYEVVTNLTEFGEGTFIRQKYTNEITLPTLSFNVWPADPDLHVVGTPVQVEPDQPTFQYGFVERIYTTADGASVDATTKVFTSPSAGYSVLHYLKTEGRAPNPELQPHQFTVVRSRLWNEPGLLVTNVAATIGTPITEPLHNDYPGLNGFILFTNAPYDGTGASAAYDRSRRAGPILPVNTHTEGGDLVVVWYQQNRLGVAWSGLPRQYALSWPTNADSIVIASLLGSGPLSPAAYPQAQVYFQPDDTLPGFNPNEEHALISGGVLYALRNDLNARINPKASDPYTLLKYRDPASGDWRMKVFSVVDEKDPWYFRYEGVAGREIQAPLPISTLPLMTSSNRVASGPAWQDVHGKFYARSAGLLGGEGNVVMQWFYPMQPSFYYQLDRRNGQPEYLPGDPVPWLDRRPGRITGDPVNVDYAIEWPPNVPALGLGQTLTTATGGLPDLADMAAAEIVFDSLDPDGSHPRDAAARLYDPLSPRTVKLDDEFTFPDSVRRVPDPTTGLDTFPDLPYVLRLRLFHDPRNRLLGFRGIVYTPPDGGAPITLVNVMSSRERQTITDLDTSKGTAFAAAVLELYQRTRNPNQVDADGDGKADEELYIGMTMEASVTNGVATNRVVRETLLGPKALSAGQPLPLLPAEVAHAVRFNSPDAAMQVGPKFASIVDTFTVEFWVRPEAGISLPPERPVANDARAGQRFAVFPMHGQLAYGSGAGCGVSVGTNGVAVVLQGPYLFAAPLVYPTHLVGWHHVAVTYQDGLPVLYLDGELARVGVSTAYGIRPSADLSVSPYTEAGYGPSPGPFVGAVSDFRIWDRTRTPSEIANNMGQRLTGAEPGLAGLWRFDENQGTNVDDASPDDHDGTLVNGALWVDEGPPRAAGVRYLVVAENNDLSLGGLPVGLHVIRVDDGFARGSLALIQPDNVLDERVTLRHTADFSGEPDSFVFEWYYQVDSPGFDPAALPGVDGSGVVTNLGAWVPYPTGGPGFNDITLGGGAESSLLTLSDVWWVVRYGVSSVNGPTRWSGWAGDPAGSDAVPRAMLVPGWIKRVLGGINLFAQRSSDFVNNSVNTLASTLAEAGPRYEGDVALNPSTLDNFGLIEVYETVLRRGRALSIDGTPAVDFPPADEALLLAAGRIADLYLLHANEAFADAADPTVGLTTDSTELGSVASSVFAFENQVASLLEEELALLRGRDDRSGGVGAAPVYNRLLWNFTGSDGEVAYVSKYGIPDQNSDGFVNALDAKILFPQGHGDAWGHYLTALTTYYDLLRHPNFTWTPRAQSTLVAGIPIQVNYEDERRFAAAAAAKARTGAEIVDRTRRLDFDDDPVAWFRGDFDPDPQRAWSPADWARRAAMGAYFDWVTGNAILPPVDPDPTHTGIQRVDRTTVLELSQIVTEAGAVLADLDQADAGMAPSGLARGVVPFDIDPDLLRTGFSRTTHFEQVYQRALQALQNAEVAFNRATILSSELRKQQNSVSDFSVAVAAEEIDLKNQLIEIYGYPHAGNMGAGRAFPAGYDGPDLTFWMYVDTTDVTPDNNPRGEGFLEVQPSFTALAADWGAAFSAETRDLLNPATNRLIQVEYPVSASDYAFQAAPEWGQRRAEGRLQAAIRQLVLAQAELRQQARTYEAYVSELEEQADLLDLRYGLRRDQIRILNTKEEVLTTFNALILVAKTTQIILSGLTDTFEDIYKTVAEAFPKNIGLSNDALSLLRASILATGNFAKSVPDEIVEGAEIAENALEFGKEATEIDLDRQSETLDMDFELTERVKELDVLVRQEPGLRLNVFNANQGLLQAARDLEAALAEGQRLLVQRTLFREVTAGTIQAARYRDLGLRIFRNDALQKYEAQFNLAARYIHLAAAAYDYELNLGTDAGAGSALGAQIVRERSLGELADGEPVVGRVGLASLLGRMKQNFDVLKGQLGLNNDRPEKSRFSLRNEAFRSLPANAGTNAVAPPSWPQVLQSSVVSNLWEVPEFVRYCRPFAPASAGPQPGLVLRFGTTITAGRNFFDQLLGPLDSSYDPSEYATRIRSVAVWFTGYDALDLAGKPRVYLVPVGTDRLRASDADDFTVRDWEVVDQRIPVPFPITAADLASTGVLPVGSALDGSFTEIRRHSAFRAYQDATFDLDEFNESSRLVGRSVWNTQWVLIIPGAFLHGDADKGISEFIQSVDDIKLYFQTYSVSGN